MVLVQFEFIFGNKCVTLRAKGLHLYLNKRAVLISRDKVDVTIFYSCPINLNPLHCEFHLYVILCKRPYLLFI